jgi:hypothetical protein
MERRDPLARRVDPQWPFLNVGGRPSAVRNKRALPEAMTNV